MLQLRPTFSESWYRVVNLRPRLRPTAQISRQYFRGERWYVVRDPAGNQFHRHPGDQWTAVQEGEVTFTVKGKPPQVLKAGDSNYVPRGTIHRQQNLSDKPARYIEMRVFDKGKPASETVGE